MFLVVAFKCNTVTWCDQVFECVYDSVRIKKMALCPTLDTGKAPGFLVFSGSPRPGAVLRIRIHKRINHAKPRYAKNMTKFSLRTQREFYHRDAEGGKELYSCGQGERPGRHAIDSVTYALSVKDKSFRRVPVTGM